MDPIEPDQRTTAFTRILNGLLRPLVRALIAQGITVPTLYRILKRIYVQVAVEELSEEGRPTDSRVSLVTGVHRRDVKQFREEDENDPDAPEARRRVTTIASVLGRWLASPDMTDPEGRPLPLPRTARSADALSFEGLVTSINRDVRPRTVLDELRRQGLVTIEDDLVTLDAIAVLGPADLDQKVHFFAENVGDHIAAAVDNLLAQDPRFMERAVFYNRLTPASVDAIEAEARKLGSQVMAELNRLAHERQSADLEAPEGTHRFRYGVFFYREDEAAGPGPDAPAAGGDDNDDA